MIDTMDSLYSIVSSGAVSASAKKVFAGGERVFVRVLGEARSENGAAGRYAVSFGGMRFFADSLRPLRPGDSFPALIKFQDGKIALAPQWEGAQAASESAFAALSQLGMPSDAVSFAIVRFMQQYGLSLMLNPRRARESSPSVFRGAKQKPPKPPSICSKRG